MNRKVLILSDSPSDSLDIKKVERYIGKYHGDVEYAGDFFKYLSLTASEKKKYRSFLETIKIEDIESPLDKLNRNKDSKDVPSSSRPPRDFYDGYWLQRKLNSFLNKIAGKYEQEPLVVVITGLLFGTFGDKRYHARVIMLGEPNIISTSGVVEAPARPPEYYWIKARFLQSERDLSQLDEIYKDKYVIYDDDRLTDIVNSYSILPIANELRARPFCDDHNCCLFNSHWQKEVLDIQYKGILCDKCENLLKNG